MSARIHVKSGHGISTGGYIEFLIENEERTSLNSNRVIAQVVNPNAVFVDPLESPIGVKILETVSGTGEIVCATLVYLPSV